MTSTEPKTPDDWRDLRPDFQKAIDALENHAKLLVQEETPVLRQLPMMRNKAGELQVDLDVKDPQLLGMIAKAEAAAEPSKCYGMGETLQADAPVFLIDGLAMFGQMNMVCGEAKVGKSSFLCSLLASLNERKTEFLGREILETPTRLPILVFGTDQTEGDWVTYLQRDKLIDENKKITGLDFFCSSDGVSKYNLTSDGIDAICEVVSRYEFPVVVIDSLSSMMELTGHSEVDDSYGAPLRSFMNRMGAYGATTIVVHHTKKGVKTWDWVNECRGSGKLTHVPSWGVLMRFVSSDDVEGARTDTRIGFTAKGRLAAPAEGLMAQYMGEEGWKPLGSLEKAQAADRVLQKIGQLGQTIRGSVFDYVTMRSNLGADVCADEVATELDKKRQNTSRELRLLEKGGLIVCSRQEDTGSRPKKYFSISPAAAEALDPSFPHQAPQIDSPDSFGTSINNINNLLYSCGKPKQGKGSSIAPFTSVELLQPDGSWTNGWHVLDGTNLQQITVFKHGNETVTKGVPSKYQKPLVWDTDVRPCQATATSDPSDF